MPQLRLDDLLAELQVRLAAVVSTRDRVHSLLEAVVAIGGNLDLDLVLRQIIEAAVSLVDARYGALGVIGDAGRLTEFVTFGLDEEQIAAIDHWPEGRGLLGELITNPQPLRLRRYVRPSPVLRLPGRSSADEDFPRRTGPDPG